MLDRRVLLAAVFTLCGLQGAALPVHVALDWPVGTPQSVPASAHIQAVWSAGAGSSGAPPAVEADAGPDGVVLDLGEGVWEVQASAPGYWSQGTDVAVSRKTPASVRLALWPAASLHGEIAAPEGELLPDAIEVRLSAIPTTAVEVTAPQAPALQPAPNPPHAELRCRIDEGTWSCLGPAGVFDMQLEAVGYAPRYEWGVNLKVGESTDIGRTELRRTASVFGRAVRKDGSNPPGPCRATLRPDVLRGAPQLVPGSARQAETSYSVLLSPRGYFQVTDVTPGKYELSVECPAASGIRELSVQTDSETRIDPPLLLGELTLDIAVTPKADPDGQPWQLTVDATAPSLRRIADKARTAADGHWARHGLAAGNYRVTVTSSDGTPWLQRDFELGAGSGTLSLRTAFVRVAGRVLLSTQPVRARLVFFNDEAAGAPVTLTSDDHGSFQGLLPVAAGVRETSWVVEAHVMQPPSIRRLTDVSVSSATAGAKAWLDLDLPTIAVRGTVVSEEGQPQRGVQVTLEDSSKVRTIASTDDAGGFELPHLQPGKYTAVAESDEGVSDRVALEVLDGSESELKLILKSLTRITFHVVSSQGPVSDAAVQVWIPPGVPRFFARTDQDGGFQVKLPTGITEVGLTVGASGYALKMARLPVSSDSNAPPDANTVTLSASAGTLVLDLKPSGPAAETPPTPYLVHNGAIQEAATLAGWGTGQSGAIGDGPATVEAIEPGVYALCFLADPADLATIWQGALPPDRCRKGTLEQSQELTLSQQ